MGPQDPQGCARLHGDSKGFWGGFGWWKLLLGSHLCSPTGQGQREVRVGGQDTFSTPHVTPLQQGFSCPVEGLWPRKASGQSQEQWAGSDGRAVGPCDSLRHTRGAARGWSWEESPSLGFLIPVCYSRREAGTAQQRGASRRPGGSADRVPHRRSRRDAHSGLSRLHGSGLGSRDVSLYL